jgi:hypothetical protein
MRRRATASIAVPINADCLSDAQLSLLPSRWLDGLLQVLSAESYTEFMVCTIIFGLHSCRGIGGRLASLAPCEGGRIIGTSPPLPPLYPLLL